MTTIERPGEVGMDGWTADRRQAQAERIAEVHTNDPVEILAQRYWPVDAGPPDPTDIRAWCRYLDAQANVGAGAPR